MVLFWEVHSTFIVNYYYINVLLQLPKPDNSFFNSPPIFAKAFFYM